MAVWKMPSPVRAAAIANGWRSGLEEKVGNQLAQAGVPDNFESEKIEYTQPSRKAKYTPDFPIHTKGTEKKIYIETKGQFKVADRQKHLLIRAQRPDLDIRFVFSRSKATISKQSKTTYADWCNKHGFLFADKLIPEDWLNE